MTINEPQTVSEAVGAEGEGSHREAAEIPLKLQCGVLSVEDASTQKSDPGDLPPVL